MRGDFFPSFFIDLHLLSFPLATCLTLALGEDNPNECFK